MSALYLPRTEFIERNFGSETIIPIPDSEYGDPLVVEYAAQMLHGYIEHLSSLTPTSPIIDESGSVSACFTPPLTYRNDKYDTLGLTFGLSKDLGPVDQTFAELDPAELNKPVRLAVVLLMINGFSETKTQQIASFSNGGLVIYDWNGATVNNKLDIVDFSALLSAYVKRSVEVEAITAASLRPKPELTKDAFVPELILASANN